jgi:hypothetical protein
MVFYTGQQTVNDERGEPSAIRSRMGGKGVF